LWPHEPSDVFLLSIGAKSRAILPIVLPQFAGVLVFVWKVATAFDTRLQAQLIAMLGYFRLALKDFPGGAANESLKREPPFCTMDRQTSAIDVWDHAFQKSQEALRESEERLRLALASSSQGMFDFDPRSDRGSCDDYIAAACGIGPGKRVTWKMFLEAIHPEDLALRDKTFEAACDPAGSGEYITEYRTIGIEDHAVRTISVRAHVYLGGSPLQPVRIVGTLRDVTAFRNEEQQLLRANLDLRQFAYAAGHDLQEPLRNISISLGALEESVSSSLTERQREWLNEAWSGATRMHQMVKDLLLYANVSRGRHDGSSTDASRCLHLALKNLSGSIAHSSAQIVSEPLPQVTIMEDHLVLVFQHLISNAIKFAKPGQPPEIKISISRTKSHWHISVADSGIGFDPVYADRIFGVFKRLHTRDAYTGNGIGLAICARIVYANGGQIWAEGRLGEGATFHFTLPVRV
jgi:signal transduction histidine kinase